MEQDDSTDTVEKMCELSTPIILQKQRFAFYNIPPPRLNIISPYPRNTREQLDMRRKVEVLKYTGVQQNTKTNGFTKKQVFANLAKKIGNSRKVSQYSTNANTNLECLSDSKKPTSTTACNVPGPPMILQYDPDVPLYNYGNHKNNRSYAITTTPLVVEFIPYTKNIIDVINEMQYSTFYDNIQTTFTYNGELGDLIIKNTSGEMGYSFNIYTPIAVWFNASIGGPLTDEVGTIITKNNIEQDLNLDIKINKIIVSVYYNDILITRVEPPIINNIESNKYNLNIPDNNFVNTVCNIKNTRKEKPYLPLFYGINYVGMLNISIPLKTPPQTVYNFKYEVEYTYNSVEVSEYLDFIQTGVYANLLTLESTDVVNDPYIFNCDVTSSPVKKTPFTPTMFTPYYNTNG